MARGVSDAKINTSTKARHLCVLIHGLWGNSEHLQYISQSLQEKHGEDELVILACKRTASSFTYDGIDICGERVAREIEETLEQLEKDGYKIARLSVVGYSLGGLIARYAIGLLDHKGYFEHIQPVNFTTFASPHLGVRTPLLGYANHVWNILGARALSASGRQLFGIDNFRNTGKSILAVLADPDSIFVRALARFERRTLYANIVNDRSVVYYTAGISRTDPYKAIDKLKLNYVKGYEPVILDTSNPYELKQSEDLPTFYERLKGTSSSAFRRAPIFLALTVLIPIGVVVIILNSTIQTFRSRRRIMLHESDQDGQGFGVYRIPYMVNEVRAGLEDVFEAANAAQRQDYLPAGFEEVAQSNKSHRRSSSAKQALEADLSTSSTNLLEKPDQGDVTVVPDEPRAISGTITNGRQPESPTLALTTSQFDMIATLNQVGFHKYPVHIQQSRHSHAAIIVRHQRGAFSEGKVVIRHWLAEEFEI